MAMSVPCPRSPCRTLRCDRLLHASAGFPARLLQGRTVGAPAGVTSRHSVRGNFQCAAPIFLDAQVVIPMTRIPKRFPSCAFTFLLLAAAMATGAHAQTGRTRAEVKAELAEAIRTGNMIGSGESGLTQRGLNPQRYGVTAGSASTLTRAQVTGEFQQARAAGELVGVGESGLPLNEMQPGHYPQKAAVAGRTRAEVRAELREPSRSRTRAPPNAADRSRPAGRPGGRDAGSRAAPCRRARCRPRPRPAAFPAWLRPARLHRGSPRGSAPGSPPHPRR